MSISFSAVGFKERQQQNRVTGQQQSMIGSAVPDEHPNPKKFRESQLVPGTPLPAKGTCKHYPHSYRLSHMPHLCQHVVSLLLAAQDARR